MPTVLLLHPSRYYCKGLAASLKRFRDLTLFSADTPEKALKLADEIPDIVLADIEGFFFLPKIHNHLLRNRLKVVLIVPEKQKSGQNAHLSGSIPVKENAMPQEFYNAINEAMNAEQRPVCVKKRKRSLSKREWEVAVLLSEGNKNAEVAEILHIDQKTVCTYRVRLFEKLKIRSLAQLKGRLDELAAAE